MLLLTYQLCCMSIQPHIPAINQRMRARANPTMRKRDNNLFTGMPRRCVRAHRQCSIGREYIYRIQMYIFLCSGVHGHYRRQTRRPSCFRACIACAPRNESPFRKIHIIIAREMCAVVRAHMQTIQLHAYSNNQAALGSGMEITEITIPVCVLCHCMPETYARAMRQMQRISQVFAWLGSHHSDRVLRAKP